MRTTVQLHWLNIDNRAHAYTFYKQYMPYAHLTKKERLAVFFSEIPSTNEHLNPEIIAAVRLRPIGIYTLVTGMLIHPSYRGIGLGHQLMQGLSKELVNEHTFLFALPHLVAFYRQHGFGECQNVPNDIGQLFNKYHSETKPLYLMEFKDEACSEL